MKRYLILVAAVLLVPMAALAQPWSDNFDSYSNYQNLHGVGGWLGWDINPNSTAFVTNTQSSSAPHSVRVDGTGPGGIVSNLVQEFSTPGTGVYTLHADTYFPANSTGSQYFNMLNQYIAGGRKNWSTQTQFDHNFGRVLERDPGITDRSGWIPIVYDRWAPIDMVIDLDNDLVSFSYNNTVLYTDQPWSQDGDLDIGAMNLWSHGSSVMYYDNMELVPEPATMTALGVGLLLLIRRRRRKTSL